jgi:hypothetical protein
MSLSAPVELVTRPAPDPRRSHHPIPTQDEIASIIAMRDPGKRNFKITQTYHELTLALADLIGSRNVSWCAYATWASLSAGRFIRVRGELRRTGPFARPFARVAARLRSSMAEGNLIVFEEMAPIYARLVELLSASASPARDLLEAHLDRFAPGPVEEGGQDMLRRAFAHYYEAAFLPEGQCKAELIFLANALVGYHEQTRLQSAIAGALGAPLALSGSYDREGRDPLAAAMAERIERAVRAFGTRWVMSLNLPRVTMSVGKDVPPLSGGRMFPEELRTLDNPELRALLYQLDRTPNTTCGSAAADWADLPDRMNFVVDLFRSRQQDPSLYRAPFTAAQAAAIRALPLATELPASSTGPASARAMDPSAMSRRAGWRRASVGLRRRA